MTNSVLLTAPADNVLEQFTNTQVTCYSCKSSTAIGNVKSVTGPGGLYEANFVNSSGQTEMSPNGSLTVPTPEPPDRRRLWIRHAPSASGSMPSASR